MTSNFYVNVKLALASPTWNVNISLDQQKQRVITPDALTRKLCQEDPVLTLGQQSSYRAIGFYQM